ncbi:cytochrome c oxidase subunit II [Cyanobium gracile UHCC 0139]|uniref:Cytochrome c oxidase subunit 2 n=1 Tax=Cyanobium gracile UHCC 0139 TaxID=3110308 RepID=A0ABU5RTL6_9CYAN|nr:cytochrome c oxidase subunit II [Cyanobium gracile]MEA5391055.1 cytochrome c oxidase subunit II [Cyanobium gracile UHCC 0139]
MPIPSSLVTLLVGMALVLSGLWVGYNVDLLPLDASANAPVYDSLFRVLFSIGTILFLGIVGLVVFSLVRFRRRSGDHTDGLAIEGNLLLEIVWTAIPAVVVLFVGIYSYDIYERMGGMSSLNDHSAMHRMPSMETMEASVTTADPALDATGSGPLKAPRVWGGIGTAAGEANVLPVEVTAMQFAFIFHYPEGDITSGELHVPNGRPVELRMKANDVIHAFWVPQFRLKQDVIPGQPTVLTFTPTKAGSYPIICAELCGPYHGGMRSTVVVHEPEAYDAWLQKNSPVTATVAVAAGNPTA